MMCTSAIHIIRAVSFAFGKRDRPVRGDLSMSAAPARVGASVYVCAGVRVSAYVWVCGCSEWLDVVNANIVKRAALLHSRFRRRENFQRRRGTEV